MFVFSSLVAASAIDRLVVVNDICGGLGRGPVMAQSPRPTWVKTVWPTPRPSLMLVALRKISESRPLCAHVALAIGAVPGHNRPRAAL